VFTMPGAAARVPSAVNRFATSLDIVSPIASVAAEPQITSLEASGVSASALGSWVTLVSTYRSPAAGEPDAAAGIEVRPVSSQGLNLVEAMVGNPGALKASELSMVGGEAALPIEPAAISAAPPVAAALGDLTSTTVGSDAPSDLALGRAPIRDQRLPKPRPDQVMSSEQRDGVASPHTGRNASAAVPAEN